MTWEILEKMFNRALAHTFSKKKWLFALPITIICGLITVICRVIAEGTGQWVGMSLAFLPIFLCAGIFLAGGILLTRVYHHEVKGLPIHYFSILKGARSVLWGISSIAVPLIFTYLVLWMVLGVFFLLRAIPVVGQFIGAILSFGPFLLVLGSIVLSFGSLLLLFFVTPNVALSKGIRPKVLEEIGNNIAQNPFLTLALPLIGTIPLLVVVGFLSLAAVVTGSVYVEATSGFAIAFKWLFMMLPFVALLTPAIIFFFNFAAESHAYIHRKKTASA